MIIPRDKIRVFISSACGAEPEKQKYNLVRAGLRALIESTHFAVVYSFEAEGASTLSAEQHFMGSIEDCDVCIFLIDNTDGVWPGVQKEIDKASKHNIKSLYYFCDQNSKEETPLQKSLKGAKYAKSKVVNSFDEFVKKGAIDLIEDLVLIYRNYCKGRLTWNDDIQNEEIKETQLYDIAHSSNSLATKAVVSNIDCCKNYFSQLVLASAGEISKTNLFDELSCAFLPALFEGKQDQLDVLERLKSEIRKHQSEDCFAVVSKRLDAVKAYYSGNQSECIAILEEALSLAKTTMLSDWLVKDILIDLRNQRSYFDESKNLFFPENKYQKELADSEYYLYYPLLDRIDHDLYEQLTDHVIKSKLQSPHTINFGHGLDKDIDALASIYAISMFYGSLTHLGMLYKRMSKFSFLCCEKYSDWNLRTLLMKCAIMSHDTKEMEGITRHFDDILCRMNESDAYDIYIFANNHPMSLQRFAAKLEALSTVGYFLSDEKFQMVWEEICPLILGWVESDTRWVNVGYHIYRTLEKIHYRLNQDELAEICIRSIEHRLRKFYDEIFKAISISVVLGELSSDVLARFIDILVGIVCDKNERDNIHYLDNALISLRKQNRELTKKLDQAISEHMPKFYTDVYRLETTEDEKHDMPQFIGDYVESIEARNKTQGVGGCYSGFADKPHQIIKSIMQQSAVGFEDGLVDAAFLASYNTLMSERQTVDEKMDAIVLLIYLIKTRPNILVRHSKFSAMILGKKEVIESGSELMSNLRKSHLRFSAQLLYGCLGEEIWTELIGILADFRDDIFSHIHASKNVLSYMESEEAAIDPKLEAVFLQNAIKWANSPNTDIRWQAVRILFLLLRNSQNSRIVCNQLLRLIDEDNGYIKTSILRKLGTLKMVDIATYEYILQKASIDTNYVVRKVAAEVNRA